MSGDEVAMLSIAVCLGLAGGGVMALVLLAVGVGAPARGRDNSRDLRGRR